MDENNKKKYGALFAVGLILILGIGILVGYLISNSGKDAGTNVDNTVMDAAGVKSAEADTDNNQAKSAEAGEKAGNVGSDSSEGGKDSNSIDSQENKTADSTSDKQGADINTTDTDNDPDSGVEGNASENNENSDDKTIADSTDNDTGVNDNSDTDISETGKTAADQNVADQTGSDKSENEKTGTDKSGSDKTGTDKNVTDKTDTDKSGTDKSGSDKTGTDKNVTDKTGTDKSGSDKTGTDKNVTDKTGTDKSGTDKSGSDKTVTDKNVTDKTGTDKSGTDKTGTDKNVTDKTGSDQTGTDKNVTDKTGTDKIDTDKSGTDKSGTDKTASYTLTYSSNNSWQNGNVNMFGMDFGATNGTSQTVSGWTVVLTIDGLSQVEGWNGSFSISGNQMTIKDAGYNADIYANGTITFGCNLGVTASTVKVTKATLNGHDMVIQAGHVDQNNQDNNVNKSGNNGGNDGGNKGGNGGGNDSISSVDVSKLLARSSAAVQGDDWLHTDGKKILDKNGKQVWLTGLNWFGYNTGTNTFDGLWNSQLEPTVKAIADHGFNLIRVPISAELINQWSNGEYPKANYNNAYNTAMNSMNSLEIWDYFLALAEASGIKVMPDIHSAETNASGHNVNLWYTNRVTVKDYYHALEWMADRYKNNDTIIAFDLKNEPHGKPYEGSGAAIWNDSKSDNNWKYVAETAAAKILAKNPNVLILVEGIEIYPMDLKKNSDYHSTNDKEYYFNWWGGNLRGAKDYPVNLGKYQNKLVYSPHDYGPTVYEQPWFKGSYDFNSLMKDCWHDNWFFIYEDNIAPLLIGEWGGFMTKPNITWMTYMRQLISKYHLNHTFWCLNANSGDTGGLLLDDFKTWDSEKYNFVKEVLWQENGKFVGLDHAIALGDNGISLSKAKGLK